MNATTLTCRKNIATLVAKKFNISVESALSMIREGKKGDAQLYIQLNQLRSVVTKETEKSFNEFNTALQSFVNDESHVPHLLVFTNSINKHHLIFKFAINKVSLAKSVLGDILSLQNDYGAQKKYHGKKLLINCGVLRIGIPCSTANLKQLSFANFFAQLYKKFGANVTLNHHYKDVENAAKFVMAVQRGVGKIDCETVKSLREMLYAYNCIHVNENDAHRLDHYQQLIEQNAECDVRDVWKRLSAISIREHDCFCESINISFDTHSSESDCVGSLQYPTTEIFHGKGIRIIDLNEYGLGTAVARKDDISLPIVHAFTLLQKQCQSNVYDEIIHVEPTTHEMFYKRLFKIHELELSKKDLHEKDQSIKRTLLTHIAYQTPYNKYLSKTFDYSRRWIMQWSEFRHVYQSEREWLQNVEKMVAATSIFNNLMFAKDKCTGKFTQFNIDGNFSASCLLMTHNMLYSFEKTFGTISLTCDKDIDYSFAKDEHAFNIIAALSDYPSILEQCLKAKESFPLINLLCRLCINVTRMNNDWIEMMKMDLISDEFKRFLRLLFWCCNIVLEDGVKILGMTPITPM